jgi:hypothetical protein
MQLEELRDAQILCNAENVLRHVLVNAVGLPL